MAYYYDRVFEVSDTSGSGNLLLGGVYQSSYVTANAAYGTTRIRPFIVENPITNEWELGMYHVVNNGDGTYSLANDEVILSSNSNAKVTWGAGRKNVRGCVPARDFDDFRMMAVARVATTANGTLATSFENGDTVDGVTLATGDIILLKDQTTGADRGLYKVAASGAPTRWQPLRTGDSARGVSVLVLSGTVNGGKTFYCSNAAGSDVVGTDSLTFSETIYAAGPSSSTDNAVVRFDGTTGKLTQNSGVLIDDSNNVTGVASISVGNTGLKLADTNASHALTIAPGSDLTANRTLTLTTGDAARTITLSGNPTLDDWFDQSVKAAATPAFGGINLGSGASGAGATAPIVAIGNQIYLQRNSDTASAAAQYAGTRSRGTSGTPTAVQSGDRLFEFVGNGHDGTAYSGGGRVGIRGFAGGNWASGDHATYLVLLATPASSTTMVEALRANGDKSISFNHGSTSPTMPSSATDVCSITSMDSAAGARNIYAINEQGSWGRLTGLGCRVATDFSRTSSTTLTNITGLSRNMAAGEIVAFEAVLFTTSNVAGGVKVAIGGTCTITSMIAEADVFDGSAHVAIGTRRVTALSTTFGDVTAVTAATITIRGTVVINAAGTLTIQFGQNASSASASTVLANSHFFLKPIGA